MKEDLLKYVVHRIEIIETKIFDKDHEKDSIKEKIASLEKNFEQEKDNVNDLNGSTKTKLSSISRRNNIKIRGLTDDNKSETARETAEKVIKFLKEKSVANVELSDIDYLHRLPSKSMNKGDIIVRFVLSFTKDQVISNRNFLAKTGTFIKENLTNKANLHILMCVKKKMLGPRTGRFGIKTFQTIR